MPPEKKDKSNPALGQEILAVAGIFASLFLLVCFISFTPTDVLQDSGKEIRNWGGAVGHFMANSLISFMGLSVIWLIVLLFTSSLQLFSPRSSFTRIPSIMFGMSGILIASSALFYLSLGDTAFFLGKPFSAGGFIGTVMGDTVRRFFGAVGAFLIFLMIFIVSLMGAVRFSPYSLARKSASWCQIGKQALFAWREKRTNRTATETVRGLASKEKGKAGSKAVIENTGEEPRVHEPIHLLEEGDKEETFQPLSVRPGQYALPGIQLLNKAEGREFTVDRDHYLAVSKILEEKLLDFGVHGKVVGISPGPVITTYEYSPAPGIKINKVVSLADDLALGLKAESVRIVGSIPGKAAIGIEIPNPERQVVWIRDILFHEVFQKSPSRLTLGLGMDVVGKPIVADLARMPHLLIAGATGSGKSVAVNTIICSILMKATPDEVRLLMVDPKRIELSAYEEIPHLLHPVVTDPKMASRALQWAVREMERRYELMEELKVKNISSYNKVSDAKLPLIVIIIDELADLMMVSSKDVEDAVARLAQMARAAGMHLILATQRPSVDVLTGLIKANFPTRMSFKVSSKIDSRTILDSSGAEHLLGAGDMLFLPPGTARIQRIHGAYISEQEIERVVDFLKEQGRAQYDEAIMRQVEEEPQNDGTEEAEDYDEKYDEAVAIVCETGQASISMVQRRLRVGYNRAARMIEIMEKEGVVGPSDGIKPREVLARKKY